MNSLIRVLASSHRFKDSVSVARGLFRVGETIVFKTPTQVVRTSSWMEFDNRPE